MKLITGLTIILLFIVLAVPVLAENIATTSAKPKVLRVEKAEKAEKAEKVELRNEKTEDSIETKIARLDDKKQLTVRKIRNSVTVRYGVYEKLIERSGNLLTKLQERIDRAQKAGLNTKVVDGYMSDAKLKLEDAKTTLESIKALQGEALDKKTFLDIQKKLIIIHKDLNIVRQNGAKIISELKKYNSENPKLTPKPTRTATTSASVKP